MVHAGVCSRRSRPDGLQIWLALACCLNAAALGALEPCAELPPPSGNTVYVNPDQADQLRAIVDAASSGTTIFLSDGFYDLSDGDAASRLVFATSGVTLRSTSGNREAVILDGDYATNELISIYASDVTVANLTLQKAYDHPIHVSGPAANPITGVLIHNVRIIDPGQQAIKVNPNADGYVDNGVIECCSIELSDAGRGHIRDNCYTGGIDIHQAQGWLIRRNFITGFWCSDGLSEHGIHLWKGCRDTVVEENLILDCARGIGFGLGSGGTARTYPDDPYPGVGYMGHIDGIIRNNFVAAAEPALFGSPDGFDTGIGLEQAHGTQVVHNSVAATEAPLSSSIEWRFGNTLAEISNNLVTHALLPRDGAQATLTGNIEYAPLGWFSSVGGGDLHLTEGTTAVDTGSTLTPGLADSDFDDETRDSLPDVGADELVDLIFSDGFESGSTAAWSAAVL